MALAIACIECVVCNLPFWTTLAASTDTASASNVMGAGLERRDDGMLVVTDQTKAYLDVSADGTSAYIRIDPVSGETLRHAQTDDAPYRALFVRADGDGRAGRMTSLSINAPRSLYLKVRANETVRLWIAEPVGAVVPIAAVRANVHVPFSFDATRVAVMAVIVLLVALWRPGSRLWRVTLDPESRGQRLAFAACMAAAAVATLVPVAALAGANSSALTFREPNAYTYDFEQYGRVADALIHGHVWLDLPVDPALETVADPYDAATRRQLLDEGAQLFWDYAYHDGHWYSYFGVLPAILLFLPYQLATGRMLPSGAAELTLMFGVLVFACLLTIRLIRRMAPRTSLAAASMAMTFVLVGSNAPYLWFRTNFYSVPCAASLLLSTMGLWLWLGASMPRRRARPDAAPLKLGHLAGGALCIAANLGCRPTFALVALLGIPLFWPQLTELCRRVRRRSIGVWQALRMPLAVVLPAVIIVAPLLAYNAVRFGSPLDFGNSYQFTVTDMTRFTPAPDTFLLLVVYYLFLPLRFTAGFPYLALSPTPLPSWAYAEEMIGGMIVLCPLLALAFAVPFLRSRLRASGCWAMLSCGVLLALAILAFDAWEGGLGWRYMIDFAWLLALAALPAFLFIVNGRGRSTRQDGLRGAETVGETAPAPSDAPALRVRRALVLLFVLGIIAVTALGFFVPGRDDALIGVNSGIYHTVRSWFTLL